MKANVLIVSADEFPAPISQHLENHGFTCFYARGGIKTRELLNNQTIHTILWLFLGHERALALDLLKIFNKHPDIPIVLITQSYDELNFADDIKGLYANLDLNDDLEDFLRTLESSCSQLEPAAIREEKTESDLSEIDFRNAVSQIFQTAEKNELVQPPNTQDQLKNLPFWNAVDQNEKKLLSEPYQPPDKKPLLTKIKDWLR